MPGAEAGGSTAEVDGERGRRTLRVSYQRVMPSQASLRQATRWRARACRLRDAGSRPAEDRRGPHKETLSGAGGNYMTLGHFR
jgi:hypothetical protein